MKYLYYLLNLYYILKFGFESDDIDFSSHIEDDEDDFEHEEIDHHNWHKVKDFVTLQDHPDKLLLQELNKFLDKDGQVHVKDAIQNIHSIRLIEKGAFNIQFQDHKIDKITPKEFVKLFNEFIKSGSQMNYVKDGHKVGNLGGFKMKRDL